MTPAARYDLALHLPLTEGQVKLIEADLLKILTLHEVELAAALVAQSAYLRLLAQFLNQARAEAGIEFDADPESNDPFLDTFRTGMEGGARASRQWDRLLRTGEKQASAARLRRVVLGSLVPAIQEPGNRMGVIARYFLFALGWGKVRFGPPIGPIPYRQLNTIPLELDAPANEKIFREHFANGIESEALLAYEDLQFSHHMMLIGFGLAQWAAAGLAIRAGRTTPGAQDWTAALQLANDALGSRSDFPTRLEEDAALKTLLDALTSRPLFPFAMVRG